MTVSPSKVCPAPDCGATFHRRPRQTPAQWQTQRFCSRPCGFKGQARPRRTLSDMCGKKLHPMTGDNARVDKDGRRRCVACCRNRDANRPDRNRRRKPAPRRVRAVKPPPATPTVTPVSSPSRPPWRPSGWSPTPHIREVSA